MGLGLYAPMCTVRRHRRALNPDETQVNMSSRQSRVTSYGSVNALAASATAIFAGATALLHFPNTCNLSVSQTHSVHSESGDNTGAIKSIVLSGQGLFTAHQDGKIRVWSQLGPRQLRQVATIPTIPEESVRFLVTSNFWTDVISAIAVGNGLLYSTSCDRTLKIWRLSDFRCIQSMRAHNDAVKALAVAPDGTVYTGSADASIKVWARGENDQHLSVETLEMHDSAVNALALTTYGSVLFSGSDDQSILAWEKSEDDEGRTATCKLGGHRGAVLCLAFASGLLVSGSADRTIRIWSQDVDGGYSTIYVLVEHQHPVNSLAIVPHEENTSVSVVIYSGSSGGEIKAWRVPQH